jgi:hypothetical protein
MVEVGTTSSDPEMAWNCSSAARDLPDAAGPVIRTERESGSGNFQYTLRYLPVLSSCGTKSPIIFSNFSRWAGSRTCRMRFLPVERRSSSCSWRLS